MGNVEVLTLMKGRFQGCCFFPKKMSLGNLGGNLEVSIVHLKRFYLGCQILHCKNAKFSSHSQVMSSCYWATANQSVLLLHVMDG